MSGTPTLAYFAAVTSDEEKSFQMLTPMPNDLKLL
jgi:hypothetical protein